MGALQGTITKEEKVYCFGCGRYRVWREFVVAEQDYDTVQKKMPGKEWWYPHCVSCRRGE